MNEGKTLQTLPGTPGEQVIVIHEFEASTVHHVLKSYLRNKQFDPLDEEQWSELLVCKTLMDKLEAYLEYKAGDDVRTV